MYTLIIFNPINGKFSKETVDSESDLDSKITELELMFGNNIQIDIAPVVEIKTMTALDIPVEIES